MNAADDEKAQRIPPWPGYQAQGAGPVGEYLDILDFDPSTEKFYEPVDLNHPFLLAQDGLAPSESNPQFHQQMVYAVAMTTIQNFEQALGRKVLWAPRRLADRTKYSEYVQRLRIYPHAIREANAYYSPQKKALLFGYFSAAPANAALQMPGSLVFTCLSHDIIAHETTHAILDGMHRYYNEPSNPDVLAFHEAFADIVALFQHFTFPEVLKSQIAETKGDLGAQNLLGKLAQQFGTAIGNYGSLREAIGETVDGEWRPRVPNTEDYLKMTEPHERGSILVAAIFEAFINIYKNRVADLLRIASNGTGVLARGELQPDLVNRLAGEAAKAAGHVLSMCVRALDYCPPVDLTFGEYLRAIITADADLVSDDDRSYRLIIIEAFRRRGIYPQGIKTLSVENLRYTLEPAAGSQNSSLFIVLTEFLREYRNAIMYERDREQTSGKIMLFPGDAEYGSWASWHTIKWAAPSKTAGKRGKHLTEDILNRTVFYKVAHHLSHNGTAARLGLEMMSHPDLAAMATLDYDVISPGWKSTMPNRAIVGELLKRTKGKLMIMNENSLFFDSAQKIPLSDKIKEARSKMSAKERAAFAADYKEKPLYLQYTVRA